MQKAMKIWLMAACAAILLGLFIFGGTMTMLQWNFGTFSTGKYETNTHAISGEYQGISIITDTADVTFVPSEDASSSVVCLEQEKAKHAVAVKDSRLVIEIEDTRKWYERIGFFWPSTKITVTIPRGAYGSLSIKSSTGNVEIPEAFTFESIDVSESTGDVISRASVSAFVKIKTSTGDIRIEGISADTLDLSVSTGAVTVSQTACKNDVKISVSTGKTVMTDTACRNLTSTGSTGCMALEKVIASENLSVTRTTGDITLDRCDAAALSLKTDTGNVTGSLLTDKVFLAHTDTGRVNVPATSEGGKCQIHTDTGNIRFRIEN